MALHPGLQLLCFCWGSNLQVQRVAAAEGCLVPGPAYQGCNAIEVVLVQLPEGLLQEGCTHAAWQAVEGAEV